MLNNIISFSRHNTSLDYRSVLASSTLSSRIISTSLGVKTYLTNFDGFENFILDVRYPHKIVKYKKIDKQINTKDFLL